MHLHDYLKKNFYNLGFKMQLVFPLTLIICQISKPSDIKVMIAALC